MSPRAILFIALAWVVLNALFPLFLNSIERQYQSQIDGLVRGAITLSARGLLRFLQLFLLILMLPTILLTLLCERVYLKLFSIQYFADIQLAKNAVLGKEFPDLFVRGLRAWRKRRA